MRNRRKNYRYRPNKKRKEAVLPDNLKTFLRWTVYVVAGLFLFSMSTQNAQGSSTALLLCPLVLAISVFEQEVPSCAMGALAGLLIDVSADKLMGFTAFFLCLGCGLVSALFRQFLRKNVVNYFVLTVLLTGIYLYIDYYFFYRIWGYTGFENVFKEILLPSWLKTVIASPIIFLLVYVFDRISGPEQKLVIESQDKNIDRI